jgi:ribose 5-phosphate isomerase B
MVKIALASDHAGFELKRKIIVHLRNLGIDFEDFGCYNEESCDYADFAHPLALRVESDAVWKGIVCCGSGNGINMTVNKHQGIRSAICWNSEIAVLARTHNDANICSLPSRFISEEEAIKVVQIFMNTDFENGRHLIRIQKIPFNEG